MNRRIIILLLLDVVLIVLAICISAWIKNISSFQYIDDFTAPIIVFTLILLFVSLYFNKYVFKEHSYREISLSILKCHFIAASIDVFLMYMIREISYSRLMFFFTVIIITVLDLIIYNVWVSLKRAKIIPDDILKIKKPKTVDLEKTHEDIDPIHQELVKNAILNQFNGNILSTLEQSLNLYSIKTLVLYTKEVINISILRNDQFNSIVNLERVNNHRFINKFFEAVNSKIPIGGMFISLAETQEQRKKRLLKKFPPVLNVIYYTLDYLLKRVSPKFSITKRMYFFLTHGENRVISLAEYLGRLYSCGFKVISDVEVDGYTLVVAQKVGKPYFDMEPTYGSLIRLNRVGKKGKIIKVFKFRTMHPYSEYLQEYIYDKYNLQEGGKFSHDFRISTLGKIMRKFWIDELPMFLNVFKGELKIVGVRPLSIHYYKLYSEELQKRRIKYKPGLVPPFYVDNPKTLDDIMASEFKYFDAYDKHPLITDLRYFFLSFYNIVFRKLRSK